jgi:hypothetical protein
MHQYIIKWDEESVLLQWFDFPVEKQVCYSVQAWVIDSLHRMNLVVNVLIHSFADRASLQNIGF